MKQLPVALLSAAALAAVGVPAASTAAAAPRATSAGVSGLDRVWLRSSIQGDRFEIEGGKLARKSANRQVRALGARLIRDHTKSLRESVLVAKRLGVAVPSEPSPTEQWELGDRARFLGTQLRSPVHLA